MIWVFFSTTNKVSPNTMSFINAINAIHTNIWGMVIIAGGVVLACFHQPTIGTNLIGIGAILINPSLKGNGNQGSQVNAGATK